MNRYIFLLGFCLSCQQTLAQSLAFSVPNASTTHQGHFELTHESQIGLAGFYNSFNILTYGLTKRTELTVNAINVSDVFPFGVSYGAGFKTVQPLRGLRVPNFNFTLGANVKYGPQLGYTRNFGFFGYSHLSSTLPNWGTRFTAGVGYGTPHAFGFSRYTAADSTIRVEGNYPIMGMAIIEQPITKRFSLMADYFSGQHAQGAIIAGGQYKVGAISALVGYKRSNKGHAYDAIILELVFDVAAPWAKPAVEHD